MDEQCQQIIKGEGLVSQHQICCREMSWKRTFHDKALFRIKDMSYAFPNCLHPEQELLVHHELDPLLQMACQTKYEQDGLPKIEMNIK